ncbi:hypothetical protein PFZ49_10670 [Microbacterium lacticum]|uniref:hypothetical protein n=1 Tax=Microbacterium lacticum TaxID=33885 RepID=UPI003A8601C6
MTSGDDEIHILNEGWRLLGSDIQAELVARGWAVANLDIDDDEPLEFFWPPTAPIGYGRESDNPFSPPGRPPEMTAPRETPWILPTRIARIPSGWRVEYGEAIAQQPDDPVEYADDKALLDDLPRIEWWPMSVKEARELEHQRVLHTTYADAYDDHSLGYRIQTEPYAGRRHEIFERLRGRIQVTMADPDAWRWSGDLHARLRIIDGQMWASAVRTARAGGDGWSISGRTAISDED